MDDKERRHELREQTESSSRPSRLTDSVVDLPHPIDVVPVCAASLPTPSLSKCACPHWPRAGRQTGTDHRLKSRVGFAPPAPLASSSRSVLFRCSLFRCSFGAGASSARGNRFRHGGSELRCKEQARAVVGLLLRLLLLLLLARALLWVRSVFPCLHRSPPRRSPDQQVARGTPPSPLLPLLSSLLQPSRSRSQQLFPYPVQAQTSAAQDPPTLQASPSSRSLGQRCPLEPGMMRFSVTLCQAQQQDLVREMGGTLTACCVSGMKENACRNEGH